MLIIYNKKFSIEKVIINFKNYYSQGGIYGYNNSIKNNNKIKIKEILKLKLEDKKLLIENDNKKILLNKIKNTIERINKINKINKIENGEVNNKKIGKINKIKKGNINNIKKYKNYKNNVNNIKKYKNYLNYINTDKNLNIDSRIAKILRDYKPLIQKNNSEILSIKNNINYRNYIKYLELNKNKNIIFIFLFKKFFKNKYYKMHNKLNLLMNYKYKLLTVKRSKNKNNIKIKKLNNKILKILKLKNKKYLIFKKNLILKINKIKNINNIEDNNFKLKYYNKNFLNIKYYNKINRKNLENLKYDIIESLLDIRQKYLKNFFINKSIKEFKASFFDLFLNLNLKTKKNKINKINKNLKNYAKVLISGRIRGVAKAKFKKFKKGKISTSTITTPLIYYSNPLFTKTGKLGWKFWSSYRTSKL